MIPGLLTNLRAIDRADLDLVHAWLDDPELMRFWGFGAAASSRSQSMQRIEEWLADETVWRHPIAFIIETLDAEPCGLLILSNTEPVDRSCELSILLDAAHRGAGLGADAIEAIADTAFDQWGLHRLTVRTEAHNLAAQEFFTRNGFTFEGRLREARYFDGAWHDVLIYGRLGAEQGDSP